MSKYFLTGHKTGMWKKEKLSKIGGSDDTLYFKALMNPVSKAIVETSHTLEELVEAKKNGKNIQAELHSVFVETIEGERSYFETFMQFSQVYILDSEEDGNREYSVSFAAVNIDDDTPEIFMLHAQKNAIDDGTTWRLENMVLEVGAG